MQADFKTSAPLRVANVRDCGAVGDGVTDDTRAFQKAIDAGGAVSVPRGVYLISPIYLRSGGGLEREDGAVLRFQPDRSQWRIRPEAERANGFPNVHLVNTVNVSDVFIRGGMIDGNYRKFYVRDYFYGCGGRRFLTPATKKGDPAQLVWFHECANVTVEDLKIVNAPFWALWLHGCENVTLRGVEVEGAAEICNTDALDIDSCRHVRVSKCRVRTGDDALAVRGGLGGLSAPKPCEDVVVADCDLASAYAHAIRVGVGTGEIRDCHFSKIRMDDTRCGIWVCSKFKTEKGVEIHDVDFADITMDAICGIYVRNDYWLVPKSEPFAGTMHDIHFARVRGRSMLPNAVVGNGVGRIERVVFDDCDVRVKTPKGVPQGEFDFFSLSASDTEPWLVQNADVTWRG